MRSFFSSVADLVVYRPRLLSKIILVLMLISLVGMSMISMATGNDTYLDKNSERGIISNHYSDTFQQNTLVILFECNDPTSPDVLEYIDSIMGPIRNLQYVSGTAAVTDVIKQANNGTLPLSSGEVTAVEEKISPAILKRYVPSNLLNMAMVTLEPGLTDKKKESAMKNIISFIDSTDIPPGLSVKLTGDAAFSMEMKNEMGKSMATLILAALILMVVVMGLLFAYVSHRFLPVLIVAIGLLFTFGVVGLAGVTVSMAVISAFPVMIGLGIDYAIQFHSRLEEEARTNPLPDAIRHTITKTGPAVMYAMLATTMGFFAMFISPVPMIQGFGLVSIIGVVVCYLTSLIGIPLIAILFNYKAKGAGKSKLTDSIDSGLSRLAVGIAKNPVPVLLVVFLVAFIGIQLDSQIPIDTNQNSFVPPGMPAKVTLDKVTRTVGSTDPAPVLVYGDNVLALDSVKWMKEFTTMEMNLHPTRLNNAVSIADYAITYNNGTMPQTQSELDAALTKIPEGTKKQYLNGQTEAVIQLYTTNMETPAKSDLKDLMKGDLLMYPPPPGIKTSITGSFDLFTSLISELVESKEAMTYLGFILVALFLGLVYRNINALSPIVPIIAIVGWNAVAMYVLGIDYNPMTACLGSMTIGVAAEYTILVMERYLEEREETDDVIEAIRNSVRKIGSAILVSGLATFFGFSALILSTFPIISNFGLTTIIAVLFSLIGAVAVMPAVLSLLDQILHKVEEVEEDVLHVHPHHKE
ncbi:MAG: hydrophobe/amphiphile efflux-3 (HAE3) family transporter [Methanospirillum sp.]|uniref:efflux RND transporter permease subunit n=1 Tax=Methanospirillum sp. TaxID=45200 RepID=UPI002370C304|nr:hydrophobe/amphiphile efflux-3 (HAE3) family transporter [Methanospirillum sp.]MDD1729654.1 hydrophobe/amphiphile efflux-3 (HAE3) family transporter [Methanospirillum sp.]